VCAGGCVRVECCEGRCVKTDAQGLRLYGGRRARAAAEAGV